MRHGQNDPTPEGAGPELGSNSGSDAWCHSPDGAVSVFASTSRRDTKDERRQGENISSGAKVSVRDTASKDMIRQFKSLAPDGIVDLTYVRWCKRPKHRGLPQSVDCTWSQEKGGRPSLANLTPATQPIRWEISMKLA